MQFEWYDGTVKNIHVDLPVLYNYQVSCPTWCGLVRAGLPSNYSSLIVLLAKYCRDCCADSCPCKSAATGILTGRGDCWGFPARSECSSSENGASLIKEKLSGGVCYQGLLYIGLFLSPFSFPLHWQSWKRAMGMFPGRANNPLKWEWCEVCGTLQPVQKEGVKAEMKSSFCGFLLTGRCLCFVHAKLYFSLWVQCPFLAWYALI